MGCLKKKHLKYLVIIAVVLAIMVVPPVIVTLLVKTPPPPGANMTYDEAKSYCDEYGMRLPFKSDDLVFDWWILADYEARNAKDGHAGITIYFSYKILIKVLIL